MATKDMHKRPSGRDVNQLRTVTVSYDTYGYADSSVVLLQGNTKVLCSVTLVPGVPPFLRGKKKGWLTAEYALLPTATAQRVLRESTTGKRNGRSMEISRLIGRVFRSVVDCAVIGEQTIYLDCDVLQADGSTRTACITAASLALHRASARWVSQGIIQTPLLKQPLIAVSVGVTGSRVLLDLDYQEDCSIDADFNVVMTKSGDLVEIQGTAEQEPLAWRTFQSLCTCAQDGAKQMTAQLEKHYQQEVKINTARPVAKSAMRKKSGMFSLKNRLQREQ